MEDPLARYILAKYLELFDHNTYDFKYHFAPNGVVDWYDRTIRGAIKIHDYLRHEVSSFIEHKSFLEPRHCGPIETKTSHMRTKVFTNKTIDPVHPINRVPDRVPLKSYADSDVEDSDYRTDLTAALLKSSPQLRTPDKSYHEDLTPPASADKAEKMQNVKLTQGPEDSSSTEKQQLKRPYKEDCSKLKHVPTTRKLVSTHYEARSLLDDSSSSDDDDIQLESLYSPLRYIDVKGILRIKRSDDSDIVTSKRNQVFNEEYEERETRLRLSYRRRLSDNEIQFALIIYEAVNSSSPLPKPKRNLFTQYFIHTKVNEVESSEERATSDADEKSSTIISTERIINIQEELSESNDSLTIPLSMEQMRTPTKSTHTPPPTPKRKSRSIMRSLNNQKRLNNSPSAPIPKRSAARSLRL